ncbi:MAG TPA: tetratricopeptide repeat protein [Thermoanaerobaculia bacterium]|nr:tetratricopeptide repeat protein [Thermoanaerobaculia bacterium]
MRKRLVIGAAGLVLLIAVGAAAALYFGSRREVTTSSEPAYRAYREALENERRFYYKEARDGFAKALELDPQFAEAMLGLSRMTRGDQGLALVRRAAKLRDHLTERERMHVDMQLAKREGRSEDAVAIARRVHERYPDDVRAAMDLCEHEIMAGNGEKALQIQAELLAVEPNNANAYNQIGYYYAYRGDYEKAIENIKKYQFMAPDQANPYDSLGEIQAYSGHYDEAIGNLNQALKLKPDFFAAYLHMGIAYEGKGDYAKAIESFRKGAKEAMDEDLRHEHLRQALRAAYVAGDVPVAKELISELLVFPGEKHRELTRLAYDALLDLMEDRPVEAERRLRELQPKVEAVDKQETKKESYGGPPHPDLTFLMAQALMRQGRVDQAIPLLEELAGSPKPFVNFESRRWVFAGRALLAEAVARKGDLDRAEKLLVENRKWNPSWAPAGPSEQVVAQLRREKVLAATK